MKYISYCQGWDENGEKLPVTFCLNNKTNSDIISKDLPPSFEKEDEGDILFFTSLPLSEDFHKALLEYFELGNTGISEKKLLKMYKATKDYKAKDLVKIERKEQERRRKYDEFFRDQQRRFPFHFFTNEDEVCINSNKMPKGVYAIDEDRGEYKSTSYTLISDDKEKLIKFITECYKGDDLDDDLQFSGLK